MSNVVYIIRRSETFKVHKGSTRTYKKIYEDNELTETSTIRKFRIVQNEGNREVRREVKYYNLQMIIAIGFKINNERAVQFRKWANQLVKDYTIQGWVMDSE